jgi:hypothetical protein
MYFPNLRQLATRSAMLLTLGLSFSACDKAINVEPSNSVSSAKGFATKEDMAAGLLGCYDALQASDYLGLAYESMADLISGDITEVGTFSTTYGAIGQNQSLPDNIQISNTWTAIYDAINRDNYLLQQSEKLADPAFPKLTTQAQARALRALNYMNLLAFWGGTTQGFGYAGGLGVPLRLTPTTAIGPETTPIPRSSEADVAAAIRADLDFAIANLSNGAGYRITKSSALALRARFELRMRNYADALTFAKQVPVPSGFATSELTGLTAPDALFQLYFSNLDQNSLAFYWYPAPDGRNEFDPSAALAAAHPAGDLRLPINVTPDGTTLKYTHTATGDDKFNVIRYAEIALTIAEASAMTGDLITATAQLNVIRNRAGIGPTTAVTAEELVTDILLQRRLELADEGVYWFDLRRTNTIQSELPDYTQTFRNLFPIPQREVNLGNGVIAQNPLY